MCQAIRDGGLRCEVHRNDSIASIMVAAETTSLPKDVVEKLFVELRREGRHAAVSGVMRENYETAMERLGGRINELTDNQRYLDVYNNRTNDRDPKPETVYALRRLQGAAEERAQALHGEISSTAQRLGITETAALERYSTIRREVSQQPASQSFDEYDRSSQREAFRNNLPSDRDSVVALARLESQVEESQEPIVTRVDLSERGGGHIHSGGYDPATGRMELVFSSNPERVYSYQNIDDSSWEQISETSPSPMSYFTTNIRGRSEYQYSSAEEDQQASHETRCESCGQFANPADHSCPERAVAEAAEVSGVELSPAQTRLAVQELEQSAQEEDQDDTPDEQEVSTEDVDSDTIVNIVRETSELPEAEAEEQLAAAAAQAEADAEAAEAAATVAQDADAAAVARVQPQTERIILAGEEALVEHFGSEVAAEVANILEAAQNVDITAPAIQADENATVQLGWSVKNLDEGPDAIPSVSSDPHGWTSSSNLAIKKISNRETQQIFLYPHEVSDNFPRIKNLDELISAVREDPNRNFVTALYKNSDGDIEQVFVATTPVNFQVCTETRYASGTGYLVSPTVKTRRVTNNSITPLLPGERERRLNEFRNTTEGQRLDAAPTVQPLATAKRVVSDKTMRNYYTTEPSYAARVRLPGVRDLRSNLSDDGDVLQAEVSWEMTAGNHGEQYDHNGELYISSYSRFYPPEVTGKVGITRQGGNYAITGPKEALRCSCGRFGAYSSCTHVNRAWEDLGKQIAATASTPVAGRQAALHESGYLNSTVNRADVRLDSNIPGYEGTPVVRGFMRDRSRQVLSASPDIVDQVVSDPDDRRDVYRILSSNVLTKLPLVSPLKTALRRGPAAIDVSVEFQSRWIRVGRVTGPMVIEKQDDGTFSKNSDQLRCTCGRFTSGGTCNHINAARVAMETHLSQLEGGDDHVDITERSSGFAESVRQSMQGWEEEREIRNNTDFQMAQMSSRRSAPQDYNEIYAAARAVVEDQARLQARTRLREEAERAERDRLASLSYRERMDTMSTRQRQEREDWEQRNPEFMENLRGYYRNQDERWSNVDAPVSADIDAFANKVREETSRMSASGATLTPARESGVTDGVCDPNIPGSRRFGVELEFTFSRGVNKSTALQNIVNDLRAEGMTDQSSIQGYHSAARSGWNSWNLEQDCTVDGELVSPIMGDTAEDWAQLGKALEIVKRHGGKASVKAGSHVNVSNSSYRGDIARSAELVRTSKEHEDILFRAGADPARRAHRGTQWCAPNVAVNPMEIREDDAGDYHGFNPGYHGGHGIALNLQSSSRSENSRIEFRHWDSSLDLATIQMQVATSVAMTDYADRRVRAEGASIPRDPEAIQPLGMGGQGAPNSMSNLGGFVDKVFRRAEDRDRFVELFARNKWS